MIAEIPFIRADKWIVFFSQTGSEILELSREIGRIPDKIVVNRAPDTELHADINTVIFQEWKERLVFVGTNPKLEDYLTVLEEFEPDKTLITLHGWLRIIPSSICKMYTIYNGHPGYIIEYPELKGKDPQIRSFMGNYEKIGAVIHLVTHEVDEGKPIMAAFTWNKPKGTLEGTFRTLKLISLGLWKQFFKKYVK